MFPLVNGDMKAPATDYLRLRTLLRGMTLGFGGCTTYGVVENLPLGPDHPGPVYALSEFAENPQSSRRSKASTSGLETSRRPNGPSVLTSSD